MDKATDDLLPLAACMALSDTMRSSHQRSGFEVGSRLILSNPVFEVHCVFSNRALSSFFLEGIRARDYIVLGLSWTALTNNSKEGLPRKALRFLLDT